MSVASDNYYYYLRLLNNARISKRNSESAEQQYISQRSSKQRSLENCKSEKKKKEKRLKDVEEIVAILEGNGGWGRTSVPNAISEAVKTLTTVDNSYRSCIKRTGGRSAADMKRVFEIRTVENDRDSGAALRGYRNVASQLRSEINSLNQSISALGNAISTLNQNIRTCNSNQSSLRRKINDYEWNTEYWRRKMNAE